jgi:DNA-binding transcriptional LysR family regulator
MLNFNDVAIFIQVVQSGSFAEAGRRLGMPPNTISRRVQDLETRLHARLLVRSTRKLNLTSTGRAYFSTCAQGITDIASASEEILGAGAEPKGLIRVAVPADFFDFFPVEWVAEFLARYTKVRIDFLLADRNVDLIEESVDVALQSGSPQSGTMVARRLFDMARGLVANPGYLARRGPVQTIEILTEQECLTVPDTSDLTLWRLQGPQGNREVMVTGQFRASTVGALLRAARGGLGIALLPLAAVDRDLSDGALIRVLPEYREEQVGAFAVTPTRRQRSAAVASWIDFVAERMAGFAEAATRGNMADMEGVPKVVSTPDDSETV